MRKRDCNLSLRNFTKILLKNLFYQISIKIVEILPKVKKYTEYGHTGSDT